MARRILLITTDQQRYDTLGCNGGSLSRTPVADGLAAAGVRYTRASPQSVVCMPSRSTLLTGQHPSTHGVWMNGVPLPLNAPSVAEVLRGAGMRTALIGKGHFEPFIDPFARFAESRVGDPDRLGTPGEGPLRGFEHFESAAHGAVGSFHYARWLMANHPEAVGMYYRVLDGALEVSAAGGGDTGAPQVHDNPISRDLYHTDWVADRTIAWLEGLDAEEDWFCWMSFPDPHHPWDPPVSEMHRVDWREVPLPAGYIEDTAARERVLADKPRHWMSWYRGDLVSNYEAPLDWVPATLTADQIREVNARNAVEVELVDEAIGRVLAALAARGQADEVDVILTTDHGELQGDYGLLFKGPYHVDGLMRLPLIWRPAPARGATPAVVDRPVGLVDVAPTLCALAGVAVPEWMEGKPLPVDEADAQARGFERVLTEWDSELFGVGVHLRTITRDNWVCTTYLPGRSHEGTEGELYNLIEDPLQQVNLWDDPARRALRDDLLADLWDHQPTPQRDLAPLQAPV